MNQLYGIQISRKNVEQEGLRIDGAIPVEIPSSAYGAVPQVKVSAHPEGALQISFSKIHVAWVYVWGKPAHARISQLEIPEWCARVVANENYTYFQELLGTFVILIDEPQKKRLTIISDILGVRPLFLGKINGRLVFGSKVWPLYKAGIVSGEIDYDAVSAWISFGFNCSSGSLFTELKRIPPGTVVVIEHDQWKEIAYVQFEVDTFRPPIERIADELHEMVSSALGVLLAHVPQTTLALSGGYDSRYLLGLALALSKTDVRCVTVKNSLEEGITAQQVATTLKVPLEIIAGKDSLWDIYEEPHHFTADGFPITKFVTHLLAQRYPNVPMLNGYMGDSLIRGSKDTFQGKYEEEWKGDLVEVLFRKHLFVSFQIFRPEMAKRIEMRSRVPMEEAVRKGTQIGKVFSWADFYFRQRLYISNNFLQHIDFSEAILPFYSWAILSYKMRYDCHLFGSNVYEQIFKKHFPELGSIPRAGASAVSQGSPTLKISRCAMAWARSLLTPLCNKKNLTLLNKKYCIPRSVAGMMGFQRYESSIQNFYRLYLLESEAKKAGVNFDWENL